MSNFKSIDIASFIYENAETSSIKRSFEIFPLLKSINNRQAVYECKGSAPKPYTVKISTEDTLAVNCSCPYDFGGICKHSVASLENFALTLKNYESVDDSSKNSTSNKITKINSAKIFSNILSYPLENKLIDAKIINVDLAKGKNYYFNLDSIKVLSISPTKITTKAEDWSRTGTQIFEFISTENKLKINCTCSDKVNNYYCKHLPVAFEKILKLFGEDYFQDNYFENKKKNI